MASLAAKVKSELRKHGDSAKAAFFPRFFKAGKGEYAEGDKFIGVTVPQQRIIAKQFYKEIPLSETEQLLQSAIHEHRLTALLILDLKYQKGSAEEKQSIVDLYLNNLEHVNNWDLVDGSAPYILGPHLFNQKRDLLYKLAKKNHLWSQRIAILTTHHFIKQGDFTTTLEIAEILLNHPHDLIHKAVGWMLREVGNKNLKAEEEFLKKHYKTMPRTALRYAIEKFPETKRKKYLKGKI